MMHHSRALILRKDEWGEADWLITALAADFGKIRLRAQGARKHGAKLQGHLEPGAVSDLSFVVGRGGLRLTTARLFAFPAAVRNSLPKLGALSAMLAALDQNLLEERDGAAELLAMVRGALGGLADARQPETARRVAVWFHARLAVHLGVFPSSLSPEAEAVPALLALVAEQPSALEASGLAPDALERELCWLIRRLGGSYIAPAPVSPAPSAIY